MTETAKKIDFKSVLSKADDAVRKFLFTDAYYILVVAIVTLAWAIRSEELGFIGLIVVSSVALLFADDIMPFTVNIFAAFLMIYDSKVETFLHMWPVFIPLGIALNVFVVRNVGKHKFKLGKMFFPQLAVSVALLIGGVGVTDKEEFMRAFPNTITLGVAVLAVYLLYVNFTKCDENKDYGLAFAKIMTYIGLSVCIELVICIIRSGLPVGSWNNSYWNLGWGNRNNVATYILFTAPMSAFLATKYRKTSWIYMLICAFQYACLLATFSRGGILCGAIAAVVAVAFVIWKGQSKKENAILLAAVLVIVGVFLIIFRDKVSDMIQSLLKRGTKLSGRNLLYEEAWELFKKHPFAGVGLGYRGDGPSAITTMQVYLFHSTLFQIIASMGIVGILAYGYYYAERLYLLFRKINKRFNLFVLVAWIGFEGYSMIDTGTFIPFPNMILVMVMTFVLELVANDDKSEEAVTINNSANTEFIDLFRKNKKYGATE